MLFNSYGFIFLFLPLVIVGFYMIGNQGHHRIAISWLVGASLFFYSWWNPAYLGLILSSIFFNYSIGVALSSKNKKTSRLLLLVFGITFNLLLLGYFKYANFFVDNINLVTGNSYHLETIILPLAISFFTFQQITYLVDAYKGETSEYNFLHYCLFVTFFPQLIAGPIVHHREMLPQFARDKIYKFNHENLSVGLCIFVLGLFKKVVLADGVAIYATPVFDAAEAGVTLSFFEAWGGALAYTLQLYFDFSGYSDMAIGIARMFGIKLPVNFMSPYKASSIIDFWKCWHITLSRFLRDYLYIPLGGNRKGKPRRYINLMITMLLGGLWHGAGWTFIAWGALHGFYLIINHSWRSLKIYCRYKTKQTHYWERRLSQILTFTAIVIAWVFFRAESMNGAISILQSMAGMNGIAATPDLLEKLNKLNGFGDHLTSMGWQFIPLPYFMGSAETITITLLLLIVWYAPNTQQFMLNHKPIIEMHQIQMQRGKIKLLHNFTFAWALVLSILAVFSFVHVSTASEFLYFNF